MKKVIILTIALVLVLSTALTVWAENDATATESKETVINLYSGDFTNNLTANWTARTAGQKVTLPAGSLLKNLSVKMHAITQDVSATASARLDIFAWNVDYETTVAYDPLYTVEFTATNGTASFDIDTAEVKLTGDIYWEITAIKYDEGQWCIASGAGGVAPEGVENYIGGTKDGFVNWSNAKSIAASITVVEDPDYVPHEHAFVDGKCECGEEDPNYEPPTTEEVTTEAPTEEVTTEAPTEAATTETPTEAATTEAATTEAATTEAATTEAATTEAATTAAVTTEAATTAAATTAAATTAAEKSGCGSVVGSAVAVAVIAIAGAAAVVLKKRD